MLTMDVDRNNHYFLFHHLVEWTTKTELAVKEVEVKQLI